jgi:hypothetical protein
MRTRSEPVPAPLEYVAGAAAAEMRVVRAVGVESEMELAFASVRGSASRPELTDMVASCLFSRSSDRLHALSRYAIRRGEPSRGALRNSSH